MVNVELKKVRPVSVGKIQGLTGAIFGLLVSPVALVLGSSLDIPGGAIFSFFAFPIFYGAMGFLSGVICAAVYNLIAGWIGGIEMDLKE